MRPLRKIQTALLALLAVTCFCLSVAAPALADNSDVSAVSLATERHNLGSLGSKLPLNARLAGRLLELTNQVRAQQGLAPLKLHGGLTRVALQSSTELVGNAPTTVRSTGERLQQAGVKAGLAGQNTFLAKGLKDEELARAVLEAWLASPEDRSTLLDPRATHAGLAVVETQGRASVVAVLAGQLR